MKLMLPGLGTAAVLYGTYWFLDVLYDRLQTRSRKRAATRAMAITDGGADGLPAAK